MFWWVLIVVLLCIYKISWKSECLTGSFYDDYMSKEKTCSIKGLFVLLVFLSHAKSYCDSFNDLDRIYLFVNEQMGQLIVVPFLFYSGYGIMKQYIQRGNSYISMFPVKRILCTLVNFDFAVILFWGLQLWLGEKYSIAYVLSCLIGWNDLGNSNWYIFTTLMLYIIFWLCIIIIKKDRYNIICGIGIGITIYVILLSTLKETWWYDTAFCFWAGIIFAEMEEKVNIRINNLTSYLYTCVTIGLVFILAFISGGGAIIGNIMAITFGALIVLMSKIICINNYILQYLGNHVFSIYILQRLCFRCMEELFVDNWSNNFLFIGISFIGTILLSFVFDKLTNKFNNHLIKILE